MILIAYKLYFECVFLINPYNFLENDELRLTEVSSEYGK